jgi:hypothetical protein
MYSDNVYITNLNVPGSPKYDYNKINQFLTLLVTSSHSAVSPLPNTQHIHTETMYFEIHTKTSTLCNQDTFSGRPYPNSET